MSISLTEVAFNLVRAIDTNKMQEVTTWDVVDFISKNGSTWQTEAAANAALSEASLVPVGNIAAIYSDADAKLPQNLEDLSLYSTRLARLEEATLQTAITSVDYPTFSSDANEVEFMKFHKGLRTLKERLDTTIKTSADTLVNTVASYVQGQYNTMATDLPVNVTEAEVQSIAAGIAEKFAEDFAAKIQEKLAEITNDPDGGGGQ